VVAVSLATTLDAILVVLTVVLMIFGFECRLMVDRYVVR